MGGNIPQLKADINDLQSKLKSAYDRIAELENAPAKIIEVKVPFETVKTVKVEKPVEVIKYVDRIVEKPVKVIKYVDRIVEKPVEVIKEVVKVVNVDVPGPERIVHVPVETVRVEYVDNPALVDMIRKLQDQLRGN